jgi:polysaccharide export outer membrane protein
MPVRSRGQLLAGMGALAGLCLAGAGCQSSSLRTDSFAARTESTAPARPVASILQMLKPGEHQDGRTSGPVVSIMRPVPTAGTSGSNAVAVASAWQPVQRASAEELPQTVPSQPAVQAPAPMPTSVETPAPIEIAIQPAAAAPDDKPATVDKDDATTLHPPAALAAAPAMIVGHPPVEIGPPKEFSKQSLPPYVVEPPDILLIQSSQKILDQPLSGQHLVRPDGYVSLGMYGEVYVAGFSLEQVRVAVTEQIRKRLPTFDPRTLDVDVIAYNSKVYYIVTDGGGYGEQVYRIPVTGNETILDAMAQINGLPAVSSKKKIWLARATPGDGGHPIILPIDWRGVVMRGSGATNYQVFPGDRIYVGADPYVTVDSWLAKRLAPIERLFGITLLSSSTVNSIKNGTNAFGGTGTLGR